jgi:hypothetical protein
MSFSGTWSIKVPGGGLSVGEELVISGSNANGIPKKGGSDFWGSNYDDTDGSVTFNSSTCHLQIEAGKLKCFDPGGEGAVWTAQDG